MVLRPAFAADTTRWIVSVQLCPRVQAGDKSSTASVVASSGAMGPAGKVSARGTGLRVSALSRRETDGSSAAGARTYLRESITFDAERAHTLAHVAPLPLV